MSELAFLSLTIENFKNFSGSHNFRLDRQPGLYYVTGRNEVAPELGANGVGKSTIWDALFWCLWGKTIRDNRPANAIQPWQGAKRTEVSVQWMRGDQRQVIMRSRAPNKLVHSDVDGSLWVSAREIVQEDVPGLIGMTEEMMRRTIILGQFGALFLDLKPEAQSQMFTEALDLNTWLRAVDIAGQAEKQAVKMAGDAESELIAKRAVIANLTEQIGESEKQSALWEEDRKARIAKTERGIAQLEKDLDELEEVKQPSQPDDKELQKRKDDLGDRRVRRERIGAEAERLGDALVTLGTLVGDYRVQRRAKKKKCPTCGQEIAQADFEKKLADAEARETAAKAVHEQALRVCDDMDEDIADVKQAIDELEAEGHQARKDYQDALADWNKYKDTLRANQAGLSRLRGQLAGEKASTNVFAQSIKANKDRRTDLREKQSELKGTQEKAQREAEEAKYWVAAFREIRLSIIDQALIELEMASSRHASMLGLNDWGIKFDTERETQGGKVSYGFSVLLYPPGEDEPVKWESYSGGESQRWQLAVSFALSEVLLARAGLSPNMEVLDEPTRGLSSDGVSDLLEHLRDRALELGRAIYFVDHHSLDKGAFDATLLVTKTRKGSSAKWL